tara:strand:- start:1546 stop:2364 length:819 start_codon:yes stop_codon:yes gene_type:complete
VSLTNSGQISLDDIHVEAGGTSGTEAGINDSDIRALISASSEAEMAFDDFYGASSGPSFVGAVTRTESDEQGIDSSSEAIDLVSAGVQVGDLVVIAITADIGGYTSMSIQGMTMTKFFDSGDNEPAALVFYGTWQSGNSNPYLDGSGESATNRLRAMSLVAAIFRGTYSNSTAVNNTNGATSGMPNPPTYGTSYLSFTVIVTGHLDDDEVTMTAPTNYTMAGTAKTNSATRDNITGSSTGIAYRFGVSQSYADPGAFGGGGSDANNATSMRF